MTIKETIQKAIEGGWIAENYRHASDAIKINWLERQRGQFSGVDVSEMLLDPEFWKALEKSMLWYPVTEKPNYTHHMVAAGWFYHWHKFIDWIAEGNSIETFFKQF